MYRRRITQLRPSAARAALATAALAAAALAAPAQAGPYASAADQPGTTAIAMDSPLFVAWATVVHELVRGPQDINNPSGDLATYGAASDALGPAQGTVFDTVSLGDGGWVTLGFDQPIRNGAGADFAVFENGFADAFKELAFAEVSSNGVDFFRFAAHSLTQTLTQVGGFGLVDPTDLNNLAGKYAVGYGTPFDLEELVGVSPLLNVDAVTHVRIVDVVGRIDAAPGNPAYQPSLDSFGNVVNDPYSTPFPTGGFDLDAVGVIHQVPEPAAMGLLALGAVALGRRRHRNSTKEKRTMLSVRNTAVALAGVTAIGTSSAQITIDLDELPLTPGSFYNGSDLASGFTSGGAFFNNAFVDWGGGFTSWDGFAHSNVNNTTTLDFTNQYAAYTGVDFGGAGNYAVGYYSLYNPASAFFNLPAGTTPVSMRITNTTYTALTMRDGYFGAKKFGGASGDDPDFLKVSFIGKALPGGLGATTGTVEFYLADFRFADDGLDYIVDAWELLDLTALGSPQSISFTFEGSDNDPVYGLNTPTYFAMDNLVLVPEPAAALLGAVGLLSLRRRRCTSR